MLKSSRCKNKKSDGEFDVANFDVAEEKLPYEINERSCSEFLGLCAFMHA